MAERLFIRILVAVALCLALAAFAFAPMPKDELGNLHLPAFALEQVALYRLEIALLVFYGCLLLATPALSGLLRGRLPIEISTRGAKFAAETNESAADVEAAVKVMEGRVSQLTQGLKRVQIEIESLRSAGSSDSTQQEVASRHD